MANDTHCRLFARCWLIALVFVVVEVSAQQKVQYTQYMFNGLVINPAYAGADEALSLNFIQRKQWAGVENAPTTQTLSAHTLFMKKHIGLGAILINDKIGVHKNLSALTNYAYHIKTGSQSYFSMGLQAGVHNTKSDYASLVGYSNADPKLSNPYLTHTYLDFGMGVYFRSPRLHAGLSVPELLPGRMRVNDTISIRLSNANYFLFAKYRMPISEVFMFEPSILLKFVSSIPLSFDLNSNITYRQVLTVGLSYRKSESVDFILRGQVTPQLQFGYSYDHPIGALAQFSNGSHELMVHYLFRYVRDNVSSPR